MIRPYLSDIIINYKTQGEWEIQLEMSINFISSDDSDETRNLCTKSNNGVVTQMKQLKNFVNLFCKNIKKG